MPGLGAIASLANQAIAAQAAAQQLSASGSSQTNQSNGFGPSSIVTLSAPAQAALSGASSPTAGSASSAQAPVTVAVSSSTTSSDAEILIEEAYQQVVPKVGVTGASEVVDSQGNINLVKLNELEVQQDQKALSKLSA